MNCYHTKLIEIVMSVTTALANSRTFSFFKISFVKVFLASVISGILPSAEVIHIYVAISLECSFVGQF